MFNKDWELNLDALEVSHHHLTRAHCLNSPWPPPAAGASAEAAESYASKAKDM